MSLYGSRVWARCLFDQASQPLWEKVGKASGLGAPGSRQSLWVGSQLQDPQGKCSECGDVLMEAQEEVKTLRQQAVASAGSVTHCACTAPLVRPLAPVCYLCAPCVYPQFLLGLEVCVWGLLLRSSGNVPPLRP